MKDIDDGSDKPLGYQTDDGELEVRGDLATGQIGYHETELGQHQRWLRQAPDLYELYQRLLETVSQRPIVAYRVEPDPDGGDWHVLTFADGRQRHILTRHPLVEVDAETH